MRAVFSAKDFSEAASAASVGAHAFIDAGKPCRARLRFGFSVSSSVLSRSNAASASADASVRSRSRSAPN